MLLAVPAKAQEAPQTAAQSVVLMDGESGRILYEKNSGEERPIASITKIMTALIAIEGGGLDEEVPIKREYTLTEGSSLYLKPGETLTLRELLYGLLLVSGNDAALAIAGHCAGSTEAFVQKMNDKVKALGLTN